MVRVRSQLIAYGICGGIFRPIFSPLFILDHGTQNKMPYVLLQKYHISLKGVSKNLLIENITATRKGTPRVVMHAVRVFSKLFNFTSRCLVECQKARGRV